MINNAEHLRVLKVSRQSEVVGMTDFDFFPRELAEGYYSDEQEVISSGVPLIGREEPVGDRAGNRRWLSTTKVPVRDRSGEVAGLVGMSRDITDRKLVEQELSFRKVLLEAQREASIDGILVVSIAVPRARAGAAHGGPEPASPPAAARESHPEGEEHNSGHGPPGGLVVADLLALMPPSKPAGANGEIVFHS